MQTVIEKIPVLGAGIGFREPLKTELFLNRSKVDWLEITTDHFLNPTPYKAQELGELISHFELIPHCLDMSLGSAEGIDRAYADQVGAVIDKIKPPYWSDHIAFTRAGGIEIGHLTPLPFTTEALNVLAENVKAVQKIIQVPLILENITTMIDMPGEMSEAEFLRRLVEETGIGLLLDVTNLYTNSVNHGYDVDQFLEHAPMQSVVQLHFTGGEWQGDFLLDTHSTATSEEVWSLLDRVVEIAHVRGVLLERDENIPPFAELELEIDRAREIGRKYQRWA